MNSTMMDIGQLHFLFEGCYIESAFTAHVKYIPLLYQIHNTYTSVTRTLMAHLPWQIRTCFF